jgi:hypothetical protein
MRNEEFSTSQPGRRQDADDARISLCFQIVLPHQPSSCKFFEDSAGDEAGDIK